MIDKNTEKKEIDINEDFLDDRGLNYRKVMFVEHYIRNGGNGRQAAIEAGYAEKSADAQASVMLVNQKVRELIRTRMRQKIESIHLTYES
ncbi:terminase small subunit, partial [Flavobacterium sp.]|uniref:terminase small subunit n=1 Tax=Flavobacterium sp. TaxID=239 RepID=UPI003F697DF7